MSSPTVVTFQAVGGCDLPTGRLIALVTLGGNRVSVSDAGGHRFHARWIRAGVTYLMAGGPTTLGEFMTLLLSLDWPRP